MGQTKNRAFWRDDIAFLVVRGKLTPCPHGPNATATKFGSPCNRLQTKALQCSVHFDMTLRKDVFLFKILSGCGVSPVASDRAGTVSIAYFLTSHACETRVFGLTHLRFLLHWKFVVRIFFL